jgi:hypothetical protein
MALARTLPLFSNEVIRPPGHLLRQHPEEHPSQLPRRQRLPDRIQTAVCIKMHQDASKCIKYHRSASRMSVFLVFGMCSRLETKNTT